MKEQQTGEKAKKRRMIGIGVLLIAGLLLCALLIPFMERLVAQGEQIRLWAEEHAVMGRGFYLGIVLLQVLLAVIPGEPVEILGGYLFGAVEGTLLCLGGAALGSLAVFCLVRKFGVGLVHVIFSREKLRNLRFLQNSPRRIFLFCLIFMVPGTPKDLLCYYAGLTDMKLPVFLIIATLGRLPALVTSTVGGDALGERSYLFALAVFVVALGLSGLGFLLYDWICKKHGEN